jgi:hypothetical protein
VTAVAVAPARSPLREDLAEALWSAVLWHTSPDAAPGRAQAYEQLYDAAITAPDDATALELVRAAISAGTAEAGDLPGITPGGDAGTEDELNSMTGVGK